MTLARCLRLYSLAIVVIVAALLDATDSPTAIVVLRDAAFLIAVIVSMREQMKISRERKRRRNGG